MRFESEIQRAGPLTIVLVSLISAASGQIPTPTVPGATTARGRIEGKVLLPGGQPVDKRIKIILSTLRDPGMITYTDTGGYFKYDSLAPGVYSVEAIDDSNRYESGIERVSINRAERIVIQVYLREKKTPAENLKGEVVSAHASDQEVPGPAKREYEKAKQLAKDGMAQDAIEHLRQAIKIYPAYLMAHNDLGIQYLKLGQLPEAADQFGAAIEIDPKAFNPRLNIGIVMIQQQKYSEALDQLTQAVSIDSSQPAGHLYIGVAYLGGDSLESAERELRKALELGGPTYWVAHYHLAGVHLKKGEREGAIRELEVYLQNSPSGPQAKQARLLLDSLKQN
jgi:tetratricopeptide (TPR) repeat protein